MALLEQEQAKAREETYLHQQKLYNEEMQQIREAKDAATKVETRILTPPSSPKCKSPENQVMIIEVLGRHDL